jgi:hypothetical protein
MSDLRIQQYQVITEEGQTVQLEYDLDGDILEIFFEEGAAGGAIELADPLISRFDRRTGNALSLSILTFSQVIQISELGPRSFQLDGLISLPPSLKQVIIKMITTPPVSHFLNVVVYYPTAEQPPIPISTIKRSAALPMPLPV